MRYGPVQLVLDVPDGDVLPAWAADPHQRQATAVVFLDANGGRVVETLHLPAAYCVAYQEQFVRARRRTRRGLSVPPDLERPLGLDYSARRAN